MPFPELKITFSKCMVKMSTQTFGHFLPACGGESILIGQMRETTCYFQLCFSHRPSYNDPYPFTTLSQTVRPLYLPFDFCAHFAPMSGSPLFVLVVTATRHAKLPHLNSPSLSRLTISPGHWGSWTCKPAVLCQVALGVG